MDIKLQIFLTLVLIAFIVLVLRKLKLKRISIRYGVFAIILDLILIISVWLPQLYFNLAKLLGFEKPSNMIFLFAFFFVLYIIFLLLNTISQLNEKVKNLIQEVSMLKDAKK